MFQWNLNQNPTIFNPKMWVSKCHRKTVATLSRPQCVAMHWYHYIHRHCRYPYQLIEAETKWPPFSKRHFKGIFFNENAWISIKISLTFVPWGPINNIQIMAWHRPGDKPLSESMMASLPTHLCVTRPQWVKDYMVSAGILAHHYTDAIMGVMASQITSLANVYSAVYSSADQRKHQSSLSLAFVRAIHRWSVNSPHKWPVTWNAFPFGDVIMCNVPNMNYMYGTGFHWWINPNSFCYSQWNFQLNTTWNHDLRPFLLTSFSLQFRFDGNCVLASITLWYNDHYEMLHKSQQPSCKVWDKITNPPQTSAVAPLMLGNKYVISSHIF